MTPDEMEKSVKELQDNQIVQGYRLARTETNLDRLEADVHLFVAQLDRLEVVVEKLAHGFIDLQSAMMAMVQTVEALSARVDGLSVIVEGLSATVDRFIRGMQHNGHRPPDEGPEGAS
jgi:prophage DNA circulation protein